MHGVAVDNWAAAPFVVATGCQIVTATCNNLLEKLRFVTPSSTKRCSQTLVHRYISQMCVLVLCLGGDHIVSALSSSYAQL